MLKIIDTKISSAEENMAIDEKLLLSLDPNGSCILHKYQWQGLCATYGYFIKPENFFDLEATKTMKLNLARRPTGGGIIFHIWDCAFSVLMPSNHKCFSNNTLKNYEFINNCVLMAVQEFLSSQNDPSIITEDFIAHNDSCNNFCMAKPTKYDVVINGKKVAGAAQRKKNNGYLHQGSISLVMPDIGYLKKILLPNIKILDAICSYTYPLLLDEVESFNNAKEQLFKLLEKYLTQMIAQA
jgi:lipoate---protein ligase